MKKALIVVSGLVALSLPLVSYAAADAAITNATVNAATTLKDQAVDTLTSVLPILMGVVAFILVIFLTMRLFKRGVR